MQLELIQFTHIKRNFQTESSIFFSIRTAKRCTS